MALIALAADKGSPGVTTAAVAMAAVWPRRSLLAEVDAAGGDLVYRSASQNGGTLDPGTGMLSLAATARRGLAAEQLWDHAQRLSGGLDVLIGLGSAEQAVGLNGQWGTLGRAFAGLAESPNPEAAADVIADCGRLGPDSPVLEALPHASMVLLVSGTEPEHLARVRDRAAALSARLHGAHRGVGYASLPVIGVLVVGGASDGAKVANQVNHMLIASNSGARVMGVLADDAAGAAQLAGRRRGRVDKSLLVRSVRKVVTDLHQGYEAMLGASTRHAAPGGTGGQQSRTQQYGQPLQPAAQPQPPGGAPQQPGYGYPPPPPLPYQQGQPPEQPSYVPPPYDGHAAQPGGPQPPARPQAPPQSQPEPQAHPQPLPQPQSPGTGAAP